MHPVGALISLEAIAAKCLIVSPQTILLQLRRYWTTACGRCNCAASLGVPDESNPASRAWYGNTDTMRGKKFEMSL